MCGIVGLVMKKGSLKDQAGFVLERVESLQHRGYQGVGIASFIDKEIVFRKSTGNVQNLKKKLKGFKAKNIVIAHNRWQTHGIEAEYNSHPHLSNDGRFAVVHNGEIYNKEQIKNYLIEEGFTFNSDTDTECIPNLIQHFYEKTSDITESFRKALAQLDGSNAILLISSCTPDRIYIYNNCQTLSFIDTPDYYLIISDDSAIPSGKHIQYHIEDDDIVVIARDGFEFLSGEPDRNGESIEVDLTDASQEGFSCFMEKEIMQQPYSLSRTLAGRIDKENLDIVLGMEKKLRYPIKEYQKIILIGIGTSYNACLIGKYFLEELAHIPTEVILGSEYLNQIWLPQPERTLTIIVSQSGKTVELLDIAKKIKSQDRELISICNVVKSPLAYISDAGIFLKAGPEKAVASTKAYTSQLLALHLLALLFAKRRNIPSVNVDEEIQHLDKISPFVEKGIDYAERDIADLLDAVEDKDNFFLLGRGITWPVCFEGALKIQEIAYVHAQGFSAVQMAHGPRALLNERLPCFLLAVEERSHA